MLVVVVVVQAVAVALRMVVWVPLHHRAKEMPEVLVALVHRILAGAAVVPMPLVPQEIAQGMAETEQHHPFLAQALHAPAAAAVVFIQLEPLALVVPAVEVLAALVELLPRTGLLAQPILAAVAVALELE